MYLITNFVFNSTQLQLSQPKDKLTDEELKPYLTVSIFIFIIFKLITETDYFIIL